MTQKRNSEQGTEVFCKMVEKRTKVPAVGEVLCGDAFYTLYLATSGNPNPPVTQTTPDLRYTNTYIFSAARVAFSIIQSPGKDQNQVIKTLLHCDPSCPALPPAHQTKKKFITKEASGLRCSILFSRPSCCDPLRR